MYGTVLVRSQSSERGEMKFRSLLETAPDAIVISRSDGVISLVNTQAERLFGFSRGELIGQPIEILVPDLFRHRHTIFHDAYVQDAGGRPIGAGLALHGLRKDGSEFPVEISLSPLATDEGRVVSVAIRDVTDRRRIEIALREKNMELEAASQTKDRFFATMSHELRTPLNAIIGFTGTLLMRLPGPLNTEQEAQLHTVQSSARHLLSLINDILDLARIESGKVNVHREAVDVAAIVDEVASSLRPAAAAKGLPLVVTVSADAPASITTDRRALRQILLNLVDNAVKFTERGRVEIAVGKPSPPDGMVRFAVIDTGVGIRPQDRARLFEAFEQLERTAARRHEGTGLGLHLSHRLTTLLGGRLHVESQPGQGSTFTLTLADGI